MPLGVSGGGASTYELSRGERSKSDQSSAEKVQEPASGGGTRREAWSPGALEPQSCPTVATVGAGPPPHVVTVCKLPLKGVASGRWLCAAGQMLGSPPQGTPLQ